MPFSVAAPPPGEAAVHPVDEVLPPTGRRRGHAEARP